MSNSGERARKLARSLARRANALALALYVLGVASCGLLAHLARDVYVDENAFLLGSTSATLDDEDARRAQNDANELMRAVDVAEDRSTTTRKRLEWINRTLDDAGFESYRSPTRDGRHNAHTVARATRGGRDGVILSSGVERAIDVRSMHDVVNLATLFGMRESDARAAMTTQPYEMIALAGKRRLDASAA